MRQFRAIQFLLTLATIAWWAVGCETQNVNPPQPRANRGYMDFRADSSEDLCWQVACYDDRTQQFKNVFSELEPPAGGVLRLAFVPGHYRMQVTFLNRIVREPGQVEVEVQNGMISPVQVALIPDGTTQVQRKEQRYGSTVKGRYGWKTKHSSEESVRFRVSVKANATVPYQTKEHLR